MQSGGLSVPITIEAKDRLVILLARDISQKTGIKVTTHSSFNNEKLTVFAKNVKARELIDRIASVLGASPYATSDMVDLRRNADEATARERYLKAELDLNEAAAAAKLAALSKLEVEGHAKAPESKPGEQETPEQWAWRMRANPGYRVAALKHRVSGHVGVAL